MGLERVVSHGLYSFLCIVRNLWNLSTVTGINHLTEIARSAVGGLRFHACIDWTLASLSTACFSHRRVLTSFSLRRRLRQS